MNESAIEKKNERYIALNLQFSLYAENSQNSLSRSFRSIRTRSKNNFSHGIWFFNLL